jgi:fructose-1,6-bisphosphatase
MKREREIENELRAYEKRKEKERKHERDVLQQGENKQAACYYLSKLA